LLPSTNPKNRKDKYDHVSPNPRHSFDSPDAAETHDQTENWKDPYDGEKCFHRNYVLGFWNLRGKEKDVADGKTKNRKFEWPIYGGGFLG
jgi:hypothetical protein